MRIGVDMGGTNIRAALVDENGIVRMSIVPCPADAEKPDTVLEELCLLIEKTMENDDVEAINIGVPSVVDIENGIVYNTANIPCWKEVHLRDYLTSRFPGMSVSVNNDANCFALGEAIYGSAKGFRNVVGLTLGTGTGAGIVTDGKLYNGINAGAGEIGYLPYKDSIYENYTSGEFFNLNGVNSKDAAERARKGDQKMIALWNEFGKHVGSLVKSIILTYDPEAVVIGGGMSGASDLYAQAMRDELADFYYPHAVENLKLCFSSTPNVAILGAAAL